MKSQRNSKESPKPARADRAGVARFAPAVDGTGRSRGAEPTTVYEIGPFRLEPENEVLMRLGAAEPLGRRAVSVLAALVKNARKPMAKDAIIDAAWPGLVVEEANLSVQISSIRRVLSQTPGGERWIETLAGRGYRFVGPVVELRGGVAYDAARSGLGNLPEPLASFVGRERELVELKRLLANNRILTLVGAGGIGKTRLAVQLAAEVSDAYRDGVWFVDLAPLADPELVPSALAQTLEVQQAPGKSLTDALCRQLKGRRVLLIIDNCEHVLDASAQLIEALLHGASEPAIIATSREQLRVEGEQIYWVASLPLPDPAAALESIRQSDAVTLFVDRAQHQQPDFELTEAIAPGIAQLCVRLDGIPLALELAAPLVHTYSIDEINGRLSDRFDALTQGRRTALPRQQTLRATLDWSYSLLSDAEQSVLRNVSVFRGGFTLDAARAVAADGVINKEAMDDLLSRLQARSLVLAGQTERGTRYGILETTRAYALEVLDRAGETAATQEQHAQYFRAYFQNGTVDWLRQAETQWRARYCPEIDNLRAALEWSLAAANDLSLGVSLTGSSGPIWSECGLYAEGLQRLNAAADAISDAPKRAVAELWLWLGASISAVPTRAIDALQRAADLYSALRDTEGSSHALVRLARVLTLSGRFHEAAKALAAASAASRQSSPPRLRGLYFSNMGVLKASSGDHAAARRHYERANDLYVQAGYNFGRIDVLTNLAELSWQSGDLHAAASAYRQAIDTQRALRSTHKFAFGYQFANLAGVLTEQGKLDEALTAAREALPLLRDADRAFVFMDHFALRAALSGAIERAAMLGAFTDTAYAAKKLVREPNEARARERLRAILEQRLDRIKVKRLLADGEKLTEDEACRLALED